MQRERFTEGIYIPIWVRNEHLARYEFCKAFVRERVVIDCACGAGIGSEIFSKAGAKQIEAFDLSKEAIDFALKRYGLLNIHFRVGSALKLPLADGFADVYISLETIEHIENDIAFLAEVQRVLKPDGVFICSTPNRIVTNPGKALTDRPWLKYHIREYSETEFMKLLECRFQNVQLFGQNPQRLLKVHIMTKIGKRMPGHGAVRLNQMLKLPSLFFDAFSHHLVQRYTEGRHYECMIALCSRPFTGSVVRHHT